MRITSFYRIQKSSLTSFSLSLLILTHFQDTRCSLIMRGSFRFLSILVFGVLALAQAGCELANRPHYRVHVHDCTLHAINQMSESGKETASFSRFSVYDFSIWARASDVDPQAFYYYLGEWKLEDNKVIIFCARPFVIDGNYRYLVGYSNGRIEYVRLDYFRSLDPSAFRAMPAVLLDDPVNADLFVRLRVDLVKLFVFIVVGTIAGFLTGYIAKDIGIGIVGRITVGILGAFMGEWLFSQLNFSLGGKWVGLLFPATLGAVVLVVALAAFWRLTHDKSRG